MKGVPSKKWEGLIETVRNKTFDNFKKKVIELIEEIMGEDVYKYQIKYLTNTPQPTNLTTMEWCDRIAVINSSLVYLKKGGKAMTEEEVIERVISVNLKPNLMHNFILYKGDKATTLKEVKQILCIIDHAHAHTKQAAEKHLKMKATDNKGGKEKEKGELKKRKKSAVLMC